MRNLLPIVALLTATTPAFAQQFTGGELGVEYNQLSDSSSVDGTLYHGGVEVAFNRDFSFSLNLESQNFPGDFNVATVHGIYHLSEETSVGLFYSASDEDFTNFGIEGGIEIWDGDIGGYIGQVDVDGETAVIFGLSSNNPIGANFSLFSDLDLVADSDIAVSTQEYGVEYNIPGGADIYAQYGIVEAFTAAGSGSTDYFGIGARIQFGAERGTTFETR